MKIYFERDGNKVKANVVIDVPTWDARMFTFTFDCGSEAYAGLLTNAMQSQLKAELEILRRDEYEDGWRAKAAHKSGPKAWFASTFHWRNRK